MRSSCIVFVFVFSFNTLHGQHYPSGMDLVYPAQSKYFQQQYEQVNAACIWPHGNWAKKEQAEFYSLSCPAQQLPQKQKAIPFQLDYPYSRKAATFLDLHILFWQQKNASFSKWFRNVDERSINKPKKPRFNFNYGYTLFAVKNYTHEIAYQLDEYESASSFFKQEDLNTFR